MRETEQPTQTLSGIEVQQRTNKFLGSMRHVPGLSIFEFNTKSGELNKAALKGEANLSGKIHYKLVRQPNCVYVQALNIKNAMRKLKLKPAQA